MAIRFDDDLATVKKKITQSLTKAYAREYSSIPEQRIEHGCRMYVDSRFKEHERISALSIDDISESKTYIRNSKYHLSQVLNTKYTWPKHWQVYAAHFSCESAFKAKAKIQGIEVDDHKYIEAAIKMFNQGKLKHVFNAFQAIGITTKDIFNLDQRVELFRHEYLKMVRREDEFARASKREITSIICRYRQFKTEFLQTYELSSVRQQMTARFDRAMMDLFSNYPSVSRQVKFQAGAIRLTRNIAWPVEIDVLMVGALLYPHRNSTRYGKNQKRTLEPADYSNNNPPGIVACLDTLCKMILKAQARIELDVKDIEEFKKENSMLV